MIFTYYYLLFFFLLITEVYDNFHSPGMVSHYAYDNFRSPYTPNATMDGLWKLSYSWELIHFCSPYLYKKNPIFWQTFAPGEVRTHDSQRDMHSRIRRSTN